MPDKVPEPPEDIADYDDGTAQDALSDSTTYVKWVADHEREKKWWFEIKQRVPLRKKNNTLEKHVSVDEDGEMNISADYYTDMLEYMIVDWSGANHPDAPGLKELLTGVYAGTEPGNPVFEDLQDEVPPPVAGVSEEDLKK